ncbi:MAG: hypothetical protein H7842_02515 [Gammaproteobacteria bacterium SHHR-1]
MPKATRHDPTHALLLVWANTVAREIDRGGHSSTTPIGRLIAGCCGGGTPFGSRPLVRSFGNPMLGALDRLLEQDDGPLSGEQRMAVFVKYLPPKGHKGTWTYAEQCKTWTALAGSGRRTFDKRVETALTVIASALKGAERVRAVA